MRIVVAVVPPAASVDLTLEILRWTAAVAAMLAAVLVAWGRPPRLVAWGFVLFTLASLSWIAASVLQDKPALLAQNGVLLLVNLWGLYRWWSREA